MKIVYDDNRKDIVIGKKDDKKIKVSKKEKSPKKEAQKNLQKESKIKVIEGNDPGDEHEFVRPLPKGYIPPNKSIVTFRAEDVKIGRSIYNIMEEENAD